MTSPRFPAAQPAQAQQHIRHVMATMWQRHLPEIEARLSLLDRASLAAVQGQLDPSLQKEAVAVAHKLAGSLGMYGYAHSTELARSIEQTLDTPHVPDPAALRACTLELRRSLPL